MATSLQNIVILGAQCLLMLIYRIKFLIKVNSILWPGHVSWNFGMLNLVDSCSNSSSRINFNEMPKTVKRSVYYTLYTFSYKLGNLDVIKFWLIHPNLPNFYSFIFDITRYTTTLFGFKEKNCTNVIEKCW